MVDWFCDKQVVNFSSSFPLPNTASVYIFAGGGGGTVSNTEQSCVKTPGCTMYRSLYGSVWFGPVYKNQAILL